LPLKYDKGIKKGACLVIKPRPKNKTTHGCSAVNLLFFRNLKL